MTPDRRAFLKTSSVLAAGLVFARHVSAAAKDSAPTPYAEAIVIDGNLVPPLDDAGALDQTTTLAVKSSGLTALKATIGGSAGDFAQTNADIDGFDQGIRANPALYMKIEQAADFLLAKRSGKIGIIYSFEGVEMLEAKVERIDHFRKRGVRVMQLSYNRPSPFASGVLSPQPSAGLTQLGRDAIQRMNTLGVSLDLSHCDETSTLAALAASSKPGLITHAGCAAVMAHPRNKSDAVLRAMTSKGGVVGIYELAFLARAPQQPTLDDYLRHLTHALKICGEDHVGIGSDALLMPFDTSPENMVEWNKDIAARKASGVGAPGEGPPPFVIGLNRPDRYRVIADTLVRHGYKGRVIDKILGLNFQRVFAETWISSAA
ncbi:Zn-dependent dipeptidase [Pseudolysobacter antarcticus]|uniref:Zn-dependent dipeptidase n=1 Tax=Pseudolysobacter antarcticus TaxID=2511995 RepID=A0A411HP97_9GAMM|nr:membrane dipeptidase [Pseudolysobacter antarcticus]QBB72313.1 Zn-dependent dipeptidase [Pseudolysobacter antarcticus]